MAGRAEPVSVGNPTCFPRMRGKMGHPRPARNRVTLRTTSSKSGTPHVH